MHKLEGGLPFFPPGGKAKPDTKTPPYSGVFSAFIQSGLAQQIHYHAGHAVGLLQHGHTGLRQHLVTGHA